jgi:hypothetical protein
MKKKEEMVKTGWCVRNNNLDSMVCNVLHWKKMVLKFSKLENFMPEEKHKQTKQCDFDNTEGI